MATASDGPAARTRRRYVLACGVAVAIACALALPASAAALALKRCHGDPGFQCGRVSVALDRSGAVPGTVSIFVERMRARHRPARGAIFGLAGGPGESATPLARDFFANALSGPLATRDLVVIDQRGTGRSGLLRCQPLERLLARNLTRQAGPQTEDCARRLGLRRFFYTTRDSADDIDDVRRALGYQRVALDGVSYGTKVAQAYALRHPDHVDALVLDSVVPVEGPDPFERDSMQATPRVLRALCSGRACSGITGDPVADAQRLVGRIATRGALRGYVVNSRGRRRAARLTRADLLTVLVEGDLDPVLRADTPAAIVSALRGDDAPILRALARANANAIPNDPHDLSTALYTATSCEELPFPWPRTAPFGQRLADAFAAAAAVPDSAFAPFDRATALQADELQLCSHWPEAPVAPAIGGAGFPPVRTLLLAGEEDLRTPLEDARAVAARIPGSVLVSVGRVGHSVAAGDQSGCAERAIARFFAGGRPGRCRGPARDPQPSEIVPTSLRRVSPAPGLSGRLGRTVTAALGTLFDVSEHVIDYPSRGGGLRGGSWRATANRLLLRGVEVVPGVRVSGSEPLSGDAVLRVSGSAASHGTLVVGDNGAVQGDFGGRRFASSSLGASAARARPHVTPWGRRGSSPGRDSPAPPARAELPG